MRIDIDYKSPIYSVICCRNVDTGEFHWVLTSKGDDGVRRYKKKHGIRSALRVSGELHGLVYMEAHGVKARAVAGRITSQNGIDGLLIVYRPLDT